MPEELHKMVLLGVARCQLLISMKWTWKWLTQGGTHLKFMGANPKEIETNSKMLKEQYLAEWTISLSNHQF